MDGVGSDGCLLWWVQVVLVEVDLDAEENLVPQQQLEAGEFCVVKRIPLSELSHVLSQGDQMPILGLYLFALGIELGMTRLSTKFNHELNVIHNDKLH